ncbi:Atg3p [Rhizophagus irregularis DAOM 197198w]|uniref:Autophagy-related protein 3 n=1 Tax=Rhizophagus irregularis (strain DAOM 197198w) TaxID=1432141 RepID=A0A015K6R5_RHIIW|nr:Atg3p [Rhizophagus irregularis DAOM 197198w]
MYHVLDALSKWNILKRTQKLKLRPKMVRKHGLQLIVVVEIVQQIEGEDDEITKRMSSILIEPETEKEEVDIPDYDDIPDIEDVVEDDDPAALNTTSNVVATHDDGLSDKILQVRTYDVFITYDKYYQTPRMWLFGYDEHRSPLTSTQIFEDISQDYAKKTVTIEAHPHLNMSLAKIHPCRHAQVMKKIIEKMNEEALKKFELLKQQYGNSPNAPQAEQAQVRVDQYLIIFLKFMSSVVPTIDYDHTISA